MKNMLRCNVCSNILEYELNLMNINLERQDLIIPKKLALGLNRKFSNIDMINESNCEVTIFTKLVCFKVNDIEEITETSELDDRQISFSFEVVYKVVLVLDDKIDIRQDKHNFEKALKKYAWFLLFPTLRENFNNLANKIGVQSIDIPFNLNEEDDEL